MAQSPGASDAPTMVLRLSLPSDDDFRAVAVDVAAKVAEYVGCAPPDATKVAEILASLAAEVTANGSAADNITFEFHRVNEELRIEAVCSGRKSEGRHQLG